MMIGTEAQRALSGLTAASALLGTLNSMADSIAHQVGQRLGDCIQQALVKIGILTADGEFHFLPTLSGDIAHQTRKAAEELFHGHHANFHHRALQVAEHARLESHCIAKAAAHGFLRKMLCQFAKCLLENWQSIFLRKPCAAALAMQWLSNRACSATCSAR